MSNPYLAFAIEAAFAAALCVWFVRSEAVQGRPIARPKQAVLAAVLVGGSLFFVPNATTSMRTLFGL